MVRVLNSLYGAPFVLYCTRVEGAPIIGELPCSGIGAPTEVDYVKSITAVWHDCGRSNEVLLRGMKEDANSSKLLEACRKDAAQGRMSWPAPIADCDLASVLLHPRFGVEQLKPDGSTKLRAADDFSWSASDSRKAHSVNGHTAPAEKLCHDTLDALASAMSLFVSSVGEIPGLLKADIDSAFRRIPIRADHRWACGVAFLVRGMVAPVSLASVCVCFDIYLP